MHIAFIIKLSPLPGSPTAAVSETDTRLGWSETSPWSGTSPARRSSEKREEAEDVPSALAAPRSLRQWEQKRRGPVAQHVLSLHALPSLFGTFPFSGLSSAGERCAGPLDCPVWEAKGGTYQGGPKPRPRVCPLFPPSPLAGVGDGDREGCVNHFTLVHFCMTGF